MKTIHKYQIPVGISKLSLPVGSEFLSVHLQGNKVTLWVLKTNEFERESEFFIVTVVGDGWLVPPHIKKEHFVGTVQDADAEGTACHVFAHPSRMAV